ncbi:MAG: GNAT family N-acetyltransferase [Bacteroidales bacterium]|nr:MAG: GNAT family N-acetyltransferase [Bacteroidales bacterium]
MKKIASQQFQLKDGTEITVRSMKEDDLDLSFEFFKSLDEHERIYLRKDVTKKENVRNRIEQMKTGMVRRIVATCKGKIIADGALELSGPGWEAHIGEMRIIVADKFQRKGLGMIIARELYFIAAAERIEEIVIRMMRTQTAATKIFRKLGFHEEIMLPDHVKDLNGKNQDLVIMRCNMKELWKEMESFFKISDMRVHR